ncbi:hypothetical protein D9M72_617910 [compost metagenome]
MAHGHNRVSRGFVGGDVVATIIKHKNDTNTNSGFYYVTVLGTDLRDRFRYIGEARSAAERIYGER